MTEKLDELDRKPETFTKKQWAEKIANMKELVKSSEELKGLEKAGRKSKK